MKKNPKRTRQSEEGTIWSEIGALKRERILVEAARLFSERGYLGTTIDAIAEQFGATKPFVYYHFRAKIDLLVEICERGTKESLQAAEAAISAPGTPRERLTQFVRDFTLAALNNHEYVRIYFREEINLPKENADRINAMRKEIDRRLTRVLDDGIAAGQFRIEDPHMACLTIGGMISFVFAWYRASGRLTKEDICEKMVTLVLAMVGCTEPSAP